MRKSMKMGMKDLYMAENFEDLAKLAEISSKPKNTDQIARSMIKLHKKADESLVDGDEELGYVYLLRYFQLLTLIKKSPELGIVRKYITDVLGGPLTVTKIMDRLEGIAKSLRERYQEKNKQKEMEQMIIEHFDLDTSESTLVDNKHEINATCLFQMLKDAKKGILLLDCRPRNDFNASRINYDYILNVPEEVLYKGTNVGKIESELTDESQRNLWIYRAVKDKIILLDWSSAEFKADTPIWILKDVLENWDQNFENKAQIEILVNGYDNFKLCYPHECINPKYEPNPTQYEPDPLEEILYPEFEYSVSPVGVHTGPPKVDRSTKINMMNKTYAEKEHHFNEILHEQEVIVNKSLEVEKEKLIAEQSWLNETKSNEEKQRLEHRIMELESKTRDIEEENQRLKREQAKFMEAARLNNKQEAAQLEAQAKQRHIEEAELERKRIAEEQKKLAVQRERELKVARDQRRAEQTKQDEVEIISVPRIDRSKKPSQLPDFSNRIRNFSPVRGGSGKGLTGLKNLGNTCYMNSIIQCLSHTKTLEEYFVSGLYMKHRNIMSKTQCKIVEEVAAVIKALAEGHKYISSKDLKYIVGQYQRNFCGFEQQDSHEFLTILMDWLHSDLQAIRSTNTPTSSPAETAWNEFTKMRESIILRLFYGQIKSTVECTACMQRSSTYDMFSNLSLELQQHTNRQHLLDSMNSYFENERVSGWMCPNCKENRDALKKLDISRLPAVLVVHLKRFHADIDMGGYRKKQNFVTFPLKELDMRSFIARSEAANAVNKTSVYNLYAVSNHYGSMEGGHYTAYCKGGPHNKWYKFDDHHVSPIDEIDVQSSAAYILFYQLESRGGVSRR